MLKKRKVLKYTFDNYFTLRELVFCLSLLYAFILYCFIFQY